MKIHLGCDHAGFELKEKVAQHLKNKGHEVIDHGAKKYDALDDYPVFCIPAAQGVADEKGSFGIVLGGSGNGEQMAANKVKGIRAALVWSVETAKLAREHNDANVIAIGGRMHPIEVCKELIDVFLATPFSNDERHIRRIGQVSNFETKGSI